MGDAPAEITTIDGADQVESEGNIGLEEDAIDPNARDNGLDSSLDMSVENGDTLTGKERYSPKWHQQAIQQLQKKIDAIVAAEQEIAAKTSLAADASTTAKVRGRATKTIESLVKKLPKMKEQQQELEAKIAQMLVVKKPLSSPAPSVAPPSPAMRSSPSQASRSCRTASKNLQCLSAVLSPARPGHPTSA
jgi:hypothetical protein